MLYLGIDIGKNNHVASLLDEKGKVVFKAFSFSNSTDGANSLLEKISAYSSALEIGMEATGHYWLALYSFLVEQGFVIHVINPIQTDGWRNATEIRKHKTDVIDSVLIADFIRYGEFLETSLVNENVLSLRNLSRFRNYLVSSIGDHKRKTICILDQIFPEYQAVFSNVFGKTSKEILLHLSTPSEFEFITAAQLESVLKEITFKKFAAKKIHKISSVAKTSFGITFGLQSMTLQLRLLIEQMNFIEEQVNEIERQTKTLLEKLNSPITTIPGISTVIGATILGEIGDISRFSNPSKLVAYAGIDASIHQSGNYQSANNKMSKRGSPYLRTALFRAALIASTHDPVFKAYYQKKRL
ncbi:IS110 family transposase [Sporomusa acidovorans]|uniref:IS110 family transposase n=1 Tax=Sporomusa acidovorans TaxID=112900 RepID=UPI000881CBF0|nr:IS110 family transposase [Sporomusa acidovorans]OZC19002.1 transposase IS116/IS110/IS902 family protein [Sporomusa acidovorans DSM 3132]SDD72693.1 Transposase [Sporomusa acidovorans]